MDVFLIFSGLIVFVLGSYGVIYYAAVNISNLPSIFSEIEKPIPEIGFWKRQFQAESTSTQKNFDWTFGVILPVICFAFDPIVFKGESFLGIAKPFAYLLSFVSILAMMAWLIWGEKLKWLSGILAGFFAVSGLISLAIGIVLFPFSLIGLVLLIGVLGFTPLVTSIVYLRNATRAYRAAKPLLEKHVLIRSAVLSAMFGFVTPFVINTEINQRIEALKNGNVQTIEENAQILRFVAPIVSFKEVVSSYYNSGRNPKEKQALADAYREMTGDEINNIHQGLD
jgi:hypothetical protein